MPPLPDIPLDDLILWLAADRGVTLTDGAVSKWLDQSQTHADAVQGVVGARPRRVDAAQNGLPMLEFDGGDDWLAVPDGFEDLSTGLSFFAVVALRGDGLCTSVMQFSNGVEEDDIDFGRYMGSIHYEVSGPFVTGPDNAFAIGPVTLLDFVHDVDQSVQLRMNGQLLVAGDLMLPIVTLRTANFVGRSLYADCKPLQARVGEILFYARPLPSSERLLIEQYLKQKWGCCSI